jgi:conjugal transfer mating pair stabilization protein TraG
VNRRLGLKRRFDGWKERGGSGLHRREDPADGDRCRSQGGGPSVDQQRLLSAYDYARKAAESAQISDASALVKDFRSSDAYQWARGNRTSATAGYDSSSREASERQSSSDSAYGRAKELARTAQFMREWGSGTQTDFTNYAAQRLAERGLLREEDPIKMQRAVAEIAYSYARGGSAASGYVPTDSPLGPSQPLPEVMGWQSPLRDQYDSQVRGADGSAITDQANRNDADIRARQSGARVQPGKAVGNDVSGRVKQGQRDAAGAIEKGRRQVSEDAGTLSENYSATVRAGKVSPNHGGNRAVWDTVGANAGTPEIGTPPKHGSPSANGTSGETACPSQARSPSPRTRQPCPSPAGSRSAELLADARGHRSGAEPVSGLMTRVVQRTNAAGTDLRPHAGEESRPLVSERTGVGTHGVSVNDWGPNGLAAARPQTR